MNNSFYRAFEERYRGSRELIMERLRVYEPFVQPLKQLAQPVRALDLGCGRGEWLELLGHAGFDASGVDLDDGMLAACRERGLNATHADALATLRALPDDSLALVSAFHLVEHIPFDDVRTLIAEALRALQPGGLLIMETPNPENLVVGAGDFYNDPSHLRPVPPKLLLFAAEHAGFGRQRVLRLQEAPALHEVPMPSLYEVLAGASPDFSVVAQKAAPPALLAPFDAAFGADFGLDLHTLAQRFDMARDALLRDTQARLAQLADRNSHELASASHDTRQAVLGLGALQEIHQALAAQVQALAQAEGETTRRLGAVEAALGAQPQGRAQAADETMRRLGAIEEELAAQAAAMSAGRLQVHTAQEHTLGRVRAAFDDAAGRLQAALDSKLKTAQAKLDEALARSQEGLDEALARALHETARMQAGIATQAKLDARVAAVELEAHALQRRVPALADQNEHTGALVRQLEQRLQAAQEHAAGLQLRVEQAEAVSHQMGQRVLDLLASRSWRLTAPLRVLGSGTARLRGAMRRRDDDPREDMPLTARRLAGAVTRRWPWLHAQLRSLVAEAPPAPAPEALPEPETETAIADEMPPGADLSPRGLRAYRKLKRAHQNRTK